MAVSFREAEAECEATFRSLGPVFHACTQENHEIIFTCNGDFCAAMSILAICNRIFPQIRILTFQFMNNHMHIVLCGDNEMIISFFGLFKQRLGKYFESLGRYVNIKKLELKTFEIDTLEYARAAITYVNRNCLIIDEHVTPFSYPWGANSCFFNKPLFKLYSNCRQPLKVIQLRNLFHSKMADNVKTLFLLDSYVSPLSFCDIRTAENLFRSERHYFYSITKNVESNKRIADAIGETVYYTDEDIYLVANSLARDKYGGIKPSLLDPDAKIELAQLLLYDYHAGKKMIQRILKIEPSVLNSLLPTAR